MTRLLLLRHAAHDLAGRALAGRMEGLGLNAIGREQALRLADHFHGDDRIGIPQVLASSPQPRARETIAPLAARLGLPVSIAREFDEIDFGDWTGLAFEAVRQRDPEAWRRWCEQRSQARPPGGEAFEAVAARTRAGLERLRREHPDQSVLVVSHADVIKASIAGVLGLSLDRLECFDVACASLSVIELYEGGGRLVLLNATVAGG
ncbi:histidine phosphatase family protein [Ramlibacter rhizophilus]|uniref:Histidine phosphatase family protein n=1 Tax=Ramlibacter rhizophilus TaxID=1781167 RepID=A0A4Z0C086_9BURK|nr:histidine phosphatase family protein [Ramlibacter rhizophilus]TFZ04342.1 histidine phosphatase family protein [Ramlibacter rhizophilus]